MGQTKLLFATYLKNEELDELKGFMAELTSLIEKHYGFTHCVEYVSLSQVTADRLMSFEQDRTYLFISSCPPKAVSLALKKDVKAYRDAKGDDITSFVADELLGNGKQISAKMKRYRSLEGFTSMEALKLQLYYDICVLTDIGGLDVASRCTRGKVEIGGETLASVDTRDIALFAGNPDYSLSRQKAEDGEKAYTELKSRYADCRGDAEYLKEYSEAYRTFSEDEEDRDSSEICISEIMLMNSVLRMGGAITDDYRVGYTMFRNGAFADAFVSLARASSYGLGESGADFSKSRAAVMYLKMRLLPLLPDSPQIMVKGKPLEIDKEWDNILLALDGLVEVKHDLFPLLYFILRQKAYLWDGQYGRTNFYRDDVKKKLDSLKKVHSEKKFDIYRLTVVLAQYYLETDNLRPAKQYLDRALAIIQDLSKEHNGLYDMIAGDLYVSYGAYYAKKDMMDGVHDMMFSAVDRYKNYLAVFPHNKDACHKLANTYQTLVYDYGYSGRMQYAKDYLEKAGGLFEELYKTDKVTSLENTGEMYLKFAEILKENEGVSNVDEMEDCLLIALKAYKELASIRPDMQYMGYPGVVYDTLGGIFRLAGDYDEGMDYFRSAEAEYRLFIEVCGDNYKPLLARSYINMFAEPQEKDADEAVEKLKWAVEIFADEAAVDPDFYTSVLAETWRCLARAQKIQGDTDGAIESHKEAARFFDECDTNTDDTSACHVADVADELDAVADLYDQDKENDEKKRGLAEQYHLQAIGTAYCGDAAGLPNMEGSLRRVTSSYILSLLHPGLSGLVELLFQYTTGEKTDNDPETLADKVEKYGGNTMDMLEEDHYVVSQMLAAADRCKEQAKTDPDAQLYLLGAYHAISTQYGGMRNAAENEKEAKKYERKAKKLFKDEFAPREEDLGREDPDDDKANEYYHNADYSELANLYEDELKEALGADLYAALAEFLDKEHGTDTSKGDSTSKGGTDDGSSPRGKGKGRKKK